MLWCACTGDNPAQIVSQGALSSNLRLTTTSLKRMRPPATCTHRGRRQASCLRCRSVAFGRESGAGLPSGVVHNHLKPLVWGFVLTQTSEFGRCWGLILLKEIFGQTQLLGISQTRQPSAFTSFFPSPCAAHGEHVAMRGACVATMIMGRLG